MSDLGPIRADSIEGGDVYRLLKLAHQMAGMLANSSDKTFHLAMAQSDSRYGPILTVWSNGIVDLRAESRDGYHEYSMHPTPKS